MVIFNYLRYNMLGLFILFVNTNIYGTINLQSKIDTVRITFSHMGGYAVYLATACYVYQNNVYQLQTVQTDKFDDQQIPKIIRKEVVTKLLNDCIQNSTEDRCRYITITKDDYLNFIKVLNDSLLNYIPYLQNIEKEQYKLEEDYFLSLNCNDIINIIESPNNLFAYFSSPLKIELLNNKGEGIIIEPQWYFKGTAWKLKCSSCKEAYVGYNYIMSFLRDIQIDKYAYFSDRFYLLFQIAGLRTHAETKGTNSVLISK